MDEDERVVKLREIVSAALGTHKPARGQVAAYLAEKERQSELEGIDASNM